MTTCSSPPQLAPSVQRLLDRLRRGIRAYVWIEGLGAAFAWLGIAFWMSLVLDWFFEPPVAVRAAALALAAAILSAIVVQRIVARALAPLSDPSMALLLERHYPQFNESLITAVELTAPAAGTSHCNRQMLERTCRLAAESAEAVRLRKVFNPAPLRRNLAAAALLALAIGGFAAHWPQAFAVWVRRDLLLSHELWPRKTRLIVEGFPGNAVKVARGSDLTVIAKADLRMPSVPEAVDVRYRTEGGARLQARMIREGKADPTRDRFQEYSHTFSGILAPIQFDVVGGDDAVRNLRIEVVDSPTTTELLLECRYPAYTGRTPRTIPVTGVMQIPQGSHVTLCGKANKDLDRVLVERAWDEPPKPAAVVRPLSRSDRRRFRYRLSPLAADVTLLLTLLDTDGIKSREPVRVALAAVADEKPQLSVRLRGIGSAITSQARLPAEGRVTDDYGVARIWFEYTVDQSTGANGPVRSLSGNPTDLEVDLAFDLRPLNLSPGRKLVVCLKAADRCELNQGPGVGASQRWSLDVVTPTQLRTMLEARELALRQRFEATVQEVNETRDLLGRVGPNPTGGIAPAHRVQRAMQNSQKNAQETLGVAEAFADICEELVNNRIDTPELRLRLDQGIAQPLRHIAEVMFPELDRRLDRLQTSIGQQSQRLVGENLGRSTQQLDLILAAMRAVLDRMIEMEDFNEAVDLLREIIRAQEELHQKTKQRQKQKLRDLLE